MFLLAVGLSDWQRVAKMRDNGIRSSSLSRRRKAKSWWTRIFRVTGN
ncbi:hypothetical protein ACLBR5_13970 [Escherichia coli]